MGFTISDQESSAASAPTTEATVLSTDAVLCVDGADARSYLHSQFSSGITGLATDRSVLTSYSDPRGRLLAVLRVLPRGPESIALVMDADVLDTVANQLRKYALRARVTCTQPGEDWLGLGVLGPDMEGRLERCLAEHDLGPLPAEAGAHLLTPAGVSIVRAPGDTPRWLLWAPRDALTEFLEVIGPPADDAMGIAAWRRLDIEAGVPRITAATRGRFVAQMINLDRLDAIDFRKGCYPGQEVIARTHYLGRIKRRMFILDVAGAPPAPGTTICTPERDAAIGEIVDAEATASGSVALAVLRLEAAADELRIAGPDGPAASARIPPYGVEDEG